MNIYKLLKWGRSTLRIIKYKIKYNKQLRLDYSENTKPVYFGKNVKISIDKGCTLQIGGGTYLSDDCKIYVMDNSKCAVIGCHNYFGSSCRIMLRVPFKMGNDNLLADNISIYDHNHNYEKNEGGFNSREIEMGSGCWLATNVVVTAGTQIGDKVIVGANSVVGGHLNSNGVYVASRAKRIKEI